MKADRKVINQIALMFIPVVGIWWLLGRIIPEIKTTIDWWDIESDKAMGIVFICIFLQSGLIYILETFITSIAPL